jgi:hypothetical protein
VAKKKPKKPKKMMPWGGKETKAEEKAEAKKDKKK